MKPWKLTLTAIGVLFVAGACAEEPTSGPLSPSSPSLQLGAAALGEAIFDGEDLNALEHHWIIFLHPDQEGGQAAAEARKVIRALPLEVQGGIRRTFEHP